MKNVILRTLAGLNFISFMFLVSTIDNEIIFPYWWVGLINLAWLALFAFANSDERKQR